jgi:hypothetical protein
MLTFTALLFLLGIRRFFSPLTDKPPPFTEFWFRSQRILAILPSVSAFCNTHFLIGDFCE